LYKLNELSEAAVLLLSMSPKIQLTILLPLGEGARRADEGAADKSRIPSIPSKEQDSPSKGDNLSCLPVSGSYAWITRWHFLSQQVPQFVIK